MKRRSVVILLAVIAVLAAIYFSLGSQTPVGQPALLRINSGNFNELRAAFNRALGSPRVIVLLSPT
jgi:hypothetical protein